MIEFFVDGLPATKGSARGIPFRRRSGRLGVAVKNDAEKKAKPWAQRIGWAARLAMAGRPMITGPVAIEIAFFLPRPKSHFRANGTLKPNAPTHAATKPDGDKLDRCAWDAMTKIVFHDDALIVRWAGEKPYSNDGRVGARFRVTALDQAIPRPAAAGPAICAPSGGGRAKGPA